MKCGVWALTQEWTGVCLGSYQCTEVFFVILNYTIILQNMSKAPELSQMEPPLMMNQNQESRWLLSLNKITLALDRARRKLVRATV